MRVFMLGWEFPPYISGGLGTACQGLTQALSRQRTKITFVLPKAVGVPASPHLRLLAPAPGPAPAPSGTAAFGASADSLGPADPGAPRVAGDAAGQAVRASDPLLTKEAGGVEVEPAYEPYPDVTVRTVASPITSPYPGGPEQRWARLGRPSARPGATRSADLTVGEGDSESAAARPLSVLPPGPEQGSQALYSGDLMAEAYRYARLCVQLAREEEQRQEPFDVVHAHDWLTFPAGMAVAAATGKPLVVQVHSTEFDRAGENIHQAIYDIERRGMHAAVKVVAVSYLTRSIIEHRYGVDPAKIEVVYNGIDLPASNGHSPAPPGGHGTAIRPTDKIVLFLGRITMQKGPEYFVAAAKKVLEKMDRVKFVMAGSGDKVAEVIELAAREGVGHKFTFTGFLRGPDVQRIFEMADVYVMPSVSEPFGIAALEAIRHEVPVIVSRTSGVSEVLQHALKVDFWDTHDMANKIIAVLRHPPLASTMRQFANIEARRLTWDDAASRCQSVYREVISQGAGHRV